MLQYFSKCNNQGNQNLIQGKQTNNGNNNHDVKITSNNTNLQGEYHFNYFGPSYEPFDTNSPKYSFSRCGYLE